MDWHKIFSILQHSRIVTDFSPADVYKISILSRISTFSIFFFESLFIRGYSKYAYNDGYSFLFHIRYFFLL